MDTHTDALTCIYLTISPTHPTPPCPAALSHHPTPPPYPPPCHAVLPRCPATLTCLPPRRVYALIKNSGCDALA
ncbi:hypothetical protein E2C01_068756 [Portunus trituberculatus]|uniref:Uncharacterized protein n=1 Tax=Portunus trituberculatus TaxID=210409 RepID=A0A5B7I0E3_PORTR|nr:hypothetical protein [Portunus trituberculatus]